MDLIYNNTPLLRNYLNNDKIKLLNLIPGTAKNMDDAVGNSGETHYTRAPEDPNAYVTIMINESILDGFASGKDEFGYVLQNIFHEMVHGKQQLGLGGIINYKNKPENEFEAYYYESENRNIQLSALHQSEEYGWTPIRYLEKAYKDPKDNAALIEKHRQQIEDMLTRVPANTAENIKKEVFTKTGVKL